MTIALGQDLDANFHVKAVRIFVYKLTSGDPVNVMKMPNRLAEEYLTVANEYYAYIGKQNGSG